MHELHAGAAELIEPGPLQLDEPELSELPPQPAVKPKSADDKKARSAIFFIRQECRVFLDSFNCLNRQVRPEAQPLTRGDSEFF
jgi:hypothetical protein